MMPSGARWSPSPNGSPVTPWQPSTLQNACSTPPKIPTCAPAACWSGKPQHISTPCTEQSKSTFRRDGRPLEGRHKRIDRVGNHLLRTSLLDDNPAIHDHQPIHHPERLD